MRTLLAFILALLPLVGLAQAPIVRSELTTNTMMNSPANLMIPFWNAAAGKWSNAVNNAATATNAQPPSATLTNLSATSAITNLADSQFASESTIAHIKDSALVTNILDYIALNVLGNLFVSTNSWFTNKVVVLGLQTNEAAVNINSGTSTSGGGSLRLQSFSSGSYFPSFVDIDTARGTKASPSGVLAGDRLSELSFSGTITDGSSYRDGFTIAPKVMSNFTTTEASTLVRFNIGRNASGSGKLTWSWSAYNSTNDANLIVNSNLIVAGDITGSVLWFGGGARWSWRQNGGQGFLYDNISGASPFSVEDATDAVYIGAVGSSVSIVPQVVNDVTFDSGNVSFNDPVFANESFRLPRGGNPTVNDFGEIAADNDAWVASRGAPRFYDGTEDVFLIGTLISDTPLAGQVPVFNSDGTITWENQSGSGGGGAFNPNQFSASSVTNIKDGAVLTNISIYTSLTLPTVTASRAAIINSSGQVTNSAGVDTTELEFLNGVTSAIQTQLDGKMNGQTNSAQFGASATLLTIRDGAVITNANLVGTTMLTNPPGSTAALRIWQTNANAYTEFTVPSQWLATNRFVFWQTNAAAGKLLKVNSVSISGGVATVNLTNDFAAGTEVTFSDPNGDYAATDVTTAIAELVSANGSGPNASDGKVNWSQLVSVPAGFADGTDDGGAGGTNNVAQGIGTADITNAVKRWTVHLGNDTNVVLNWSVTNYYICSPSNTFTVSWINAPAAGKPAQSMFLEIVNTNSSAGYFPTNGLNNTPVIMLSAPSTNTFVFHFDGTNYWTESGQILTTGLNDTNVFNVQPVLHSTYLKSTNLIEGNIGWVESPLAGVGNGSTNYVLDVRNHGKFILNAQSGDDGINIAAVYGGAVGVTYSFSITITNAAANEGILFSAVTNNWKWSYAQGATAPTILTNAVQLIITGELSNTNITASYAYYPWP